MLNNTFGYFIGNNFVLSHHKFCASSIIICFDKHQSNSLYFVHFHALTSLFHINKLTNAYLHFHFLAVQVIFICVYITNYLHFSTMFLSF